MTTQNNEKDVITQVKWHFIGSIGIAALYQNEIGQVWVKLYDKA